MPLTKDWKLDSTILKSPFRGLYVPYVPLDRNDTTYGFLENRGYCHYWNNKKVNKSKPYLRNKEIHFTKSYWLWKNELSFEINYYVNPTTEIGDYLQLETVSLLKHNELLSARITQFKNGEEFFIFENSVLNDKMFGKEEKTVDSILKKWKIK
ncbi:hypothetical protein ESY86_20030 [Subsaximicrobium wynnwilliamsii]|uniref:Uncharacterized protein n=1 Tax=Subsaximicrobium wynnwilliamsii TaxID=291179 RepID=A0A5C6ZC68_9FLAO|nr:hypothetical protein [Subsaximicrobium wynnwilliamsii]TXD80770.1 hypothetical protein ESY87_20165 [Subsaximicrobium wynnwilliamsii]TXD86502.1 hypothetical protein ESY86_20030 [Subsaximicrobium wynnwilliamsii]TXE00104.1 hypothetical protein ESY88_20000 [Subsaximicrobium wynnwilliamsii]